MKKRDKKIHQHKKIHHNKKNYRNKKSYQYKKTHKNKKIHKNKQSKKKYVWCVLCVLLILGIGIALLTRLFPGPGKEPAESYERSPLPEIQTYNNRQERKMKKIVKFAGGALYILLILGICIAPFLLLWFTPAKTTVENRTMASLPTFQTAEGFNWNVLSEAGDYFTDHFVFRQEMVSINAGIRSEIFGVSPVEDVIVGQNGWLYYAATLDDYQHKNSISERMLFNIAHNTALMQEYTEGLGKTFVFTIAPNKNSLYGENMPERLQFRVAEKSDAQRLLPWLVREDVNYVDLFVLFGEQEETLYYARDSHWNEKGAVMVYNALLDACGKQHETYQEAEPVQQADYFGDLGVMLFPVGGRPENRLQYPIDDTWHYAEGEKAEDQFIRTENEKGEGNLLMYRDSFGNSLLPYMAQTFSQTVFSRQVPYSMSDLVTYEPDILIVEKVERQLPTLGKVPPMMSAPARETEKVCVSVERTAATVSISGEGSYWKLEGLADPAYMDTESHIYVEVDDGSGAKLYEAFCVSSSDTKDGSTNDYGYILYVSKRQLTGDIFHVRVMTEQEEAMVVLLNEELPGLQDSEAKMHQEEAVEDEKDQEEAVEETGAEEADGETGTEEAVRAIEETVTDGEETASEETASEEKLQGKDLRNEQAQEEQTSDIETEEENTKQTKAKTPSKGRAVQGNRKVETQAQPETQPVQTATEVGRTYMEDCGTDSGYWVITYSDGHVEYVDD